MKFIDIVKGLLLSLVCVFSGIFLIISFVIIGLFYAMMPFHDFTRWQLEKSMTFLISHPSSSHLISRKTFFGPRYTDTAECTYAVGEIRSTSLSHREVLHAYGKSSANLFSFAHYFPMHVIIIEKNTSLALDNPADKWITEFMQHDSTETSDTIYYLVYLYKKGMPWWGDIRCYS
jgi:hypothetical protein